MTNYDTLEAEYYEWVQQPEPDLPSMDPQVILDANLDDTVWMYNTTDEETEWLVYNGEAMDVTE